MSTNSSLKSCYSINSTRVNFSWNPSESFNLPYLQECVKFTPLHFSRLILSWTWQKIDARGKELIYSISFKFFPSVWCVGLPDRLSGHDVLLFFGGHHCGPTHHGMYWDLFCSQALKECNKIQTDIHIPFDLDNSKQSEYLTEVQLNGKDLFLLRWLFLFTFLITIRINILKNSI